MSAPEAPGLGFGAMLPEVVRYWAPLLDAAASIFEGDGERSLVDVLPSRLKAGEWTSFAVAAAFLVADLAFRCGATAEDLRETAQQLRERAAEATP